MQFLQLPVFILVATLTGGGLFAQETVSDTSRFISSHDAQVKFSSPSKNYGIKTTAKVERGVFNTYLKFEVAGLSAPVQNAVVRLFAVDGSDDGGAIHLVSNNHSGTVTPWDERILTWANAPAIETPALSAAGRVLAATFVDFDVTAAVTGDGIFSFAIQNGSTNRVEYNTREGATPPELIILTGTDASNTKPVARNDTYLLDSPALTLLQPGVLGNDVDVDSDLLTATVITPPLLGSLTLNSDGSFSYLPHPGFLGTVKFSYQAADGRGGVDQAIVAITVTDNGFAQAGIVEPVLSTAPTAGNADDPAIWIHPTEPERSIIVGTDKVAGIYVWNMAGEILQVLPQTGRSNNIEVRSDVEFAGQRVTLVAANLRDAGKLAVFKLNPDYTGSNVLLPLADASSDSNNIQPDTYGFGLYRRPADAALFVFDRPKNGGAIRQYRISDNGTASGVFVTPVRDLNYAGKTAEGFVADDDLGFIYISEEGKGIHKYHADPTMNSDAIALFALEDGVVADREGVGLYKCDDGTGYLLLSSQGNSTVKIYERQGSNRFLKTIIPAAASGDYWLGADGLEVTSSTAGPSFPKGFVAVHDEAGSRFHLYDWEAFAGADLNICVDGGGGHQNLPPVAATDTVRTRENTPVSADVLANDRDPDGQLVPATIAITTQPGHGTASINSADSRIIYSPHAGFSGTDSFTYSIKDERGAVSTPARVTAIVTEKTGESGVLQIAANQDAYVKSTRATRNYGNRTLLKVDHPEFHAYLKFTVEGITGPVESAIIRMVVLNGSIDGGSIYSVSNNFQGTNEPWTESLVSFNNAPLLGPSALSSVGAVAVGQTVEFDVTAAISGDGTFSFAVKNQSSDKAEYSSKDGDSPPELIIRMGDSGGGGDNVRPVAVDDDATTNKGVAVKVPVLSNDHDPDGRLVVSTVTISTSPLNGNVSVASATGIVTYTPNPGLVGRDRFLYTVKDDDGAVSDPATVLVTVTTGGAKELVFAPTHDAQVKASRPTRNYGGKETVNVEAESYRAYFKFVVIGVSGQMQSARLRLYAVGASVDGGQAFAASNTYASSPTVWEESGINWTNSPLLAGQALSSAGVVASETHVEFDVKSAISGDGVYTFALSSASADKVAYSTKEGLAAPELILEVASAVASDETLTLAANVGDEPPLPDRMSLSQNYPNPFNLETRIEYALPQATRVRLTLYNLLGQEIHLLVDEIQEPGFKRVFWNGRDQRGFEMASGIYFLRLQAGRQTLTRKVSLQK